MVEFYDTHGIPHEVCGKVIVATETAQLPLLENLYKRGLENNLKIAKLCAEVKEIEPHVRCIAGTAYLQLGLLTISRFARNTPSWLDPREGSFVSY